MTMPVTPGGAYFWLYSDFDDVSRGGAVPYATAVASAGAAGSRDVLDLVIPDDLGSPNILSGHPIVLYVSGGGSNIGIRTTYDNGWWGDAPDGPFKPSNFLVELQGPSATQFVVDGAVFSITHYVSEDGGQSIYLSSSNGELLTGLTRVRLWRAEIFPGDDPATPTEFWTSFVGSREIV